ncbi:hypothetical protein B0T21DRAFT_364332 [Apiosordaria backusii]|uniref:Uncharacterized protein n=1 Tax=Apiosordaria backusii TaxID=314023 RepID=A0AA40BMU0_9PEZI|nr:hypothetical protein B0T21DRAFT_364332 [Apiosordaria backusii]
MKREQEKREGGKEEEKGTEDKERYIYINWEVDILDTGSTEFSSTSRFTAMAHQVGKLQFKTRASVFVLEALGVFRNVKEIYIVCTDRFREWHFLLGRKWPCGVENVTLVDGTVGEEAERKMLRLADLGEYVNEENKRLGALFKEMMDNKEMMEMFWKAGAFDCFCEGRNRSDRSYDPAYRPLLAQDDTMILCRSGSHIVRTVADLVMGYRYQPIGSV